MATTTTEIPVTLNKDEILRYSRHLIMPEVGMEGQQKLKAARVLCIGTGGLGSPLALYLAAAGIGTLGLVDFRSDHARGRHGRAAEAESRARALHRHRWPGFAARVVSCGRGNRHPRPGGFPI